MQFKTVPLRTRRALLLYKVYGGSALLALNGTSFNNVNAVLALSRFSMYVLISHVYLLLCLKIMEYLQHDYTC